MSNSNADDHTPGTNEPNDTPPKQPTFFHGSTELADLGRERFDHDTAAIDNRDFALYAQQPVDVKAGRAPAGLECKVFEWHTFQYTTEERDNREELKGNLHEGQLHRQNRAAREGPQAEHVAGYNGKGKGKGKARGGDDRGGQVDALWAGKKPEYDCPPLAKGFAEELDKSMFWDEPIV